MDFSSMYFQISGGIFLILLMFIYFTKKRINTFETKLYSVILILNLVGLIIDLTSTSFATLGLNETVLKISSKLYLVYLFSFYFLFTVYLKSLIAEKNSNKSLYKLDEVFSKKGSKILLAVYALVCIVILSLELINNTDPGAIYTYGAAVDFISLLAVVINIIIVYLIIKNAKKLEATKLIPIVSLVILGAGSSLLQIAHPELLIITFIYIVISFVMYFTIENPDLKLIEALNTAKNDAEKANRAKSEFLSSMSHEIRTPLNAIVGLSKEVSLKSDLDKDAKEDLEDIVNASNTLIEIVGNILDINKIESSSITVKEYEYNLLDLVSSVIRVNEPRIGNKNIVLTTSYASDLPYTLYGDGAHIKTILTNLLSNAIKYTDKGKIEVRVKCINQNDKSILIFSVEDTGKGIKEEHIKKLFDKFERLDAERNSTTEGTGLGLAITKQLIELMNGKINVQSNFGYGSLFIVQIPQVIAKKSCPLTSTQVIKTEQIKQSLEKDKYSEKKILIVDDNMLNIKVAKRLLSDYNFIIDECYDGEESLKKVNNNTYDLILMDIMMPNMSGETALKILKEDNSFSTPVIALTADAVADAQSKYLDQGFSEYLSKPFSKEEILKKVTSLIK